MNKKTVKKKIETKEEEISDDLIESEKDFSNFKLAKDKTTKE